MGDATRGKPRAASFKVMKGQDKIETNKIDVIGVKAKAISRIMMVFWEHIFHEPYSFIFIRPVPPPRFIFIIFFIFLFYGKKKK